LRENGLIEIATLYESTARLIAHPLSYRLNTGNLSDVISKLRDAVLIEV
jgi:ATP phosphoribosyltransferase